jgi:ketosteroid isomerase-like protein
MNALEVIQRFIDAFNRHDADAVNALYAEGATYHSPRFDLASLLAKCPIARSR